VGKKFEAMSYRDDIQDNEDMYEEVKQAINKNNQRKKRLLDEGKPSLDYDYLRLL
jgi:phenylalanyl-tRNA synthetase beta subunit